jgi:hypothetical protein
MDVLTDINGQLTIILAIFGILLGILLYREHRLKTQIKELKSGYYRRTRIGRILEALHLRKPPAKPPHGAFKKGDVNIRIYGRRKCKGK